MVISNIDKKKDNFQENRMILNDMKENLLEEYRRKLPNILEQRIENLATELHRGNPNSKLSELEINKLLRQGGQITKSFKYTTEELTIIFDYYQEAMTEINKKQIYPPTKKNFCAFAGISSSTYDSYLRSPDDEKREVMLMIDDFITDNTLTLAQTGKIKEITTMFRGKTEHGMVEASAPVVIEHKTGIDFNTINSRIQAIKNAEKQKTIQLKPNKDGIYEEMNE